MKRETENLLKNVSFAAGLFALLLTGFISISAQNAAPKLSVEQWQADVRFLGEELPKRHRNAFHRLKQADFEAAVKALHDRVPQLTEDEIIVGLMKIMALVKDGHSGIIPRAYFRSGLYPVKFYLFSDGLFVQRAAPEYAEMVGGRVVKIGNLSAEDAFKAVSLAAWADNEMGKKDIAPTLLKIPEILAGTKISEDKQKLSLVVEIGGKQKTFEIRPTAKIETLFQTDANWTDASGKSNPPLYRKNPGNLYWFEYLKDQKLVYVQQNGIAHKPDEPVDVFYRRVMDFVAANEVEKFVLDLRHNGGGNNFLNRLPVIEIIFRHHGQRNLLRRAKLRQSNRKIYRSRFRRRADRRASESLRRQPHVRAAEQQTHGARLDALVAGFRPARLTTVDCAGNRRRNVFGRLPEKH
jgi:hypothetical protein